MGNPGHCISYPEGTWRELRLLPTFNKPPDITFWEYTSTSLAWLLIRPASFAVLSERMETTSSNALASMNTRLTKSSVVTGSLGVK
ncbi:hypothetical protein TNCV_953021 [Trichonephila clavipes]|nr:hypothetical protein TNCV_953021 [Trichonephila clavipes]